MHVLCPRLVGVERARIGGKCLAHVLADRCHPTSQEYEHGRQQLNQESKSVNALTGLVIPQSFSIQHCWRQLGRACKLVSLKLVPYRPAGALESQERIGVTQRFLETWHMCLKIRRVG